MAGAGYKLFNTGDVLTAAQVNTYLNEQTVMVFADSAARTTALSGVLAEGMMSYLQDTDSVEVYDGTSWTAVGGGGLSSPLTTKGDVWGYSTTDARIPVGANGTVLTADSAETLGVKWAAAAGGGKVVQIVSATYATTFTSSSSTFADTGLTATITPTSASNNILVFVNQNGCGKAANNTGINLRLLRDSTNIIDFGRLDGDDGGSNTNRIGSISTAYLDSPATTSATTYKTQAASNGNNSVIILQESSGGVFATSTILLMEVTP